MTARFYQHLRHLLLLCFLLSPFALQAQNAAENPLCTENFGISTAITPSKCQSDGTITISLTGDYANYYNFYYALQPAVAGGFSIGSTSNSVLTGIPAGKYILTVSAVCKHDKDTRVIKQYPNIVVPGDYVTTKASSNQAASRAALLACATGRIALNVRAGNGPESYRFRIISAPEGVAVPQEVTPKRNGDVYTFPTDTYPAGTYRIEVSDGCYVAAVDHVVGVVTELPKLSYEDYTQFTPQHPIDQYDCSILRLYNNISQYMRANYELSKYVDEGDFEISLAPTNTPPTVWKDINFSGQYYNFDISPNKASDFYQTNSLQMHIRAKSCPDFVRTFSLNVKRPYMGFYSTVSEDCGHLNYRFIPWRSYDGIYCFPLYVTVRQGGNNASPIYQEYTINNHNDYKSVPFPYNTGTYLFQVRDADNKFTWSTTIRPQHSLSFGTILPLCDGYKDYLSPNTFSACLPITVDIVEKGTDPEKIVGSLRYTSDTRQLTPPLEYDKTYIYRVRRDDQLNTLYFVERRLPQPVEQYYIRTSSSDECRENYGYFRVFRNNPNFRPRTTISFTGPAGFIPQTLTHNPTASTGGSNLYTKTAFAPPGTYTATLTDECGTRTTTFEHPGFHQVSNFIYTTVLTCEGLLVRPTATLTNLGASRSRYYRILSGPTGGYSPAAISEGEDLKLTVEGVYTLGLLTEKSHTKCAISTIQVEYKRPTIQLSLPHTAAYVCSEQDTQGHIIVKAENGVEPYTYELYDADNQEKIDIPHTVEPNGAWHYLYGKADDVYTIRMKDACGNKFAQKVTVVNMKFAVVAGARHKVLCAGEDIELLSLPFDTYRWYAPDGTEISQEQNPILKNAKPSQSGLYRLVVYSRQCNVELEGFIDIKVLPCYAPVNPELMNRSTSWQ